jgi:hypothetical protein
VRPSVSASGRVAGPRARPLSSLRMGGGNVPRVPYKAPGEQGYQVFAWLPGCLAVCASGAAPAGRVVCTARAVRPCSDGGPIGVQFLDIWSRMQRERIMYIGQDLDDEYANQVCLGLLCANVLLQCVFR